LRRKLDHVRAEEQQGLHKADAKVVIREALRTQVERQELELRRTTAESQLHRIAVPFARWSTGTEHEPHTIPDTYVRTVALIWFGSMAALGAVGGSVIAMLSQLLMRRAHGVGLPDKPRLTTPKNNIIAVNRLLLTLRQFLARRFSPTRVRIVEVIKTRREIVAVPVPVSGISLEKLKKEFEALSGPLSEEPAPKT
jgi:hypothetical protein